MRAVLESIKPLSRDENRAIRARLDAGESPAEIAFDFRIPEIWVRRIAEGRQAFRRHVTPPPLVPDKSRFFKPDAMRIGKRKPAGAPGEKERKG